MSTWVVSNKMKKKHLITFLLILNSLCAASQKQADNWIFGDWAGLNFATGDPVPFYPPQGAIISANVVTMSDSLGNILYIFGDERVWNREYNYMLNGLDILPEHSSSRSRFTFPKPGSDSQYYIFDISTDNFVEGLYYSVIDMTLDGGLGGVTSEKNIYLDAAANAQDKIFVLKNSSGDGYWVITRLFNDDRYVSFRVTSAGVDPQPVYSSTGIYRALSSGSGPMRVSPDKKHLVSCYWQHPYPVSDMEICDFNSTTGEITLKYTLKKYNMIFPTHSMSPADCEFSPDSKFLYIQYVNGHEDEIGVYQFDMSLIEDSASFSNSGIRILENWHGNTLQLSNDGRIYFHYKTDPLLAYYQDKYIGVINRPWEYGTACDADTLAVYFNGKNVHLWLPNILPDYLYRFEWEGNQCQFSPVTFMPHFIPTPDSVHWYFDEFTSNSTSNELSPVYAFQYPGIHEVEVDIWYPTGRFEHTSREIEIFPTPQPNLGPDTLICQGTSIILNANCTADTYIWSTGQLGTPQITVSDSGTYWVRASISGTGCRGSDTIYIGIYPEMELDTSSVIITPSMCGGSTGSVTGLEASGSMPLSYFWQDLAGNPFGTNIDATGLPAGQYFLTITDANDCETTSPTYTITDSGNLQINQVELTQPHCSHADGQLIVSAFIPTGSVLEYSIDDGVSYQSDSIFTNLYAGSYIVRIRDNNGCEGFYAYNPIELTDIPGPQVTQTIASNETNSQQNGAIEITAIGSTPVLFYSIDDGNTWQQDNGTFNNLSAGIYYCLVKDENDCDTSFTIELQNEILTWLQAISGGGDYCLGNSATIPIEVSNFYDVSAFELKLSYNASNLQCDGYANVIPELSGSFTGIVNQSAGEITLQWTDTIQLTLLQQQTITDLVFTPLQAGQGLLDWYTGPSGSAFTNLNKDTIPAQFSAGQVSLYEPPQIILQASQTVCTGDMVSIMGIATGNQPPINYLWTYPDGSTTENDPFFFSASQAVGGDYTLLATDIMGCTDQKTMSLIVSDTPLALFNGTDTLVVDSGYLLNAGAGMEHYLWNTGDTTESIIINSDGMYTVNLESQEGCLGLDSVYIILRDEPVTGPSNYLYVPNAFSPNGDGKNDIFFAVLSTQLLSIDDFEMLIFDRWGGKVFETNDLNHGWDGIRNDQPCPVGTYVYRITFKVVGIQNIEGARVVIGTVVIVR